MISHANSKLLYFAYLIILLIFSFLVGPISAASAAGITADDFNAPALDTSLWQFVDPVGDGAVSMTGSQVSISVPAGTEHDVWSSGNFAPRIIQNVANTDFEIELKYDSVLSQKYQMEGFLVEQDDLTYLRFDFYTDGTRTKIFCATFTNGQPTVIRSSVITPGTPLYMRVKRVGDQWIQSYSYNGSAWTTLPAFSFPMQMNDIGIFAGNSGGNPAFSALVDYILNVSESSAPSITTQPVSQTVQLAANGQKFLSIGSGRRSESENSDDNAEGFAGRELVDRITLKFSDNDSTRIHPRFFFHCLHTFPLAAWHDGNCLSLTRRG